MHSTKTTCVFAAGLLVLLTGCASDSPRTVARTADLGRVCPAPTPPGLLAAILAHLESAPPSAGLDALATEWERLDEGVRKARGK